MRKISPCLILNYSESPFSSGVSAPLEASSDSGSTASTPGIDTPGIPGIPSLG